MVMTDKNLISKAKKDGGGSDPVIIGSVDENLEKTVRVENENLTEEKKNENDDEIVQYPIRVGVKDCMHYLHSGFCRYGLACVNNHPPRTTNNQKEVGEQQKVLEECRYYRKASGCKYGKACRYLHLADKSFTAPAVGVNSLGLPLRPGGRECVFYMRFGTCRFANNCRFHHPNPTDMGGLDPPPGSKALNSSGLSQPNVTSWLLTSNPNDEMQPYFDASSSFEPLPSAPQAYPHLERSQHVPPVNPVSPPSASMGPPTGLVPSGLPKNADGLEQQQQQQEIQVDEHPERPSEKECFLFMRTGDCKLKSSCKYHHPKNRTTVCTYNSVGLPLRPDAGPCPYYSRFGLCKHGPACTFDHSPTSGSPVLGGA